MSLEDFLALGTDDATMEAEKLQTQQRHVDDPGKMQDFMNLGTEAPQQVVLDPGGVSAFLALETEDPGAKKKIS